MKITGSQIGVTVGVLGFLFGAWQYTSAQLEKRGEERALLNQLAATVTEFKATLHEHRQLIEDARIRLATTEAQSRYMHGEP